MRTNTNPAGPGFRPGIKLNIVASTGSGQAGIDTSNVRPMTTSNALTGLCL